MRKLTNGLPTAILFVLSITACRQDEPLFISQPTEFFSANVAHDWFNEFRDLTKKTSGFTPPVAARAFGYAGVTLYETVVAGMPNHQSLAGQLDKMPTIAAPDPSVEINFAVAANTAMAYVARQYYANMPTAQLIEVQQLEDKYNAQLREKGGVPTAVLTRSKAWGQSVAAQIFEWSKTDGGHEGYLRNFPKSYTPPTGFGKWIPTAPAFQMAMQPTWGDNRTFFPNLAGVTQPLKPTTYSEDSTSTFFKEAVYVYETTKNATAAQQATAKYWSDDPGNPGTPPGHSISITTQVLQQEGLNLARSAEIYARVGMAISDAFVSCWKTKYTYNAVRPITFIRSKIDATWTPLLTTPPFPEYSSGHSVQGGALAKVLSESFGLNYTITDKTHAARTDIDGAPRTYKSFYDLASEAAVSRVYGGIHFREAVERGIEQGVRVGAAFTNLKFRK